MLRDDDRLVSGLYLAMAGVFTTGWFMLGADERIVFRVGTLFIVIALAGYVATDSLARKRVTDGRHRVDAAHLLAKYAMPITAYTLTLLFLGAFASERIFAIAFLGAAASLALFAVPLGIGRVQNRIRHDLLFLLLFVPSVLAIACGSFYLLIMRA